MKKEMRWLFKELGILIFAEILITIFCAIFLYLVRESYLEKLPDVISGIFLIVFFNGIPAFVYLLVQVFETIVTIFSTALKKGN